VALGIFKEEEAVACIVGKEVACFAFKVASEDAAFVWFAFGEWRFGSCVPLNELGAMQAVGFLLLGFGGVDIEEFGCPASGAKQAGGVE
jgi:hypothetical protein